jgi:hypothetical protein
MASKTTTPPAGRFTLPLAYTVFFLTIEPISTLVGAYFAYFQPLYYLTLTHAASAPNDASSIPPSTSIVMQQLANLYMLLSINEALILRTTYDLKVWKVFLLGLLIADVGHIWTVREAMGWAGYWQVWTWNAIDWGNLGFVYLAATMRICFLAGVGMNPGAAPTPTKATSKTS